MSRSAEHEHAITDGDANPHGDTNSTSGGPIAHGDAGKGFRAVRKTHPLPHLLRRLIHRSQPALTPRRPPTQRPRPLSPAARPNPRRRRALPIHRLPGLRPTRLNPRIHHNLRPRIRRTRAATAIPPILPSRPTLKNRPTRPNRRIRRSRKLNRTCALKGKRVVGLAKPAQPPFL